MGTTDQQKVGMPLLEVVLELIVSNRLAFQGQMAFLILTLARLRWSMFCREPRCSVEDIQITEIAEFLHWRIARSEVLTYCATHSFSC